MYTNEVIMAFDICTGGSVISLLKLGYNYVPPLYGFYGMVCMLAEIPVAAALLGPVCYKQAIICMYIYMYIEYILTNVCIVSADDI